VPNRSSSVFFSTRNTTASRLTAYSAAASLGAFAFSATSQAAIQVNLSIFGTHLNVPDTMMAIDIDGNGTTDVNINNGLNGVQALGVPGTNIISNTLVDTDTVGPPAGDGLSYYVFGFANDNILTAAHLTVGGGANLTFITFKSAYGGYNYYHHVDDGEWIGVTFDINGSTHVGAIEILQQSGHRPADPNFPNVNPNPVNSTWGRLIWNDQPGFPSIIPEPTSLLILAAGAGALGLRRKRAIGKTD